MVYLGATSYFLLPPKHIFIPGPDEITDLDGNVKFVNLADLENYKCTKEEALTHLQQNWKAAMEQTQKAWTDLYAFSRMTDQKVDTQNFETGLQEMLTTLAGSKSREQIKINDVLTAAFKGDNSSDLSQAAQKMANDVIADILKDMPKEADDLENWANHLHQKFFGEEEKQKEEKFIKETRDIVRDSISQRLRENGVEPLD